MLADALGVVFISLCSMLLAEGISWLLVYRTAEYQKLKKTIETMDKKLKKDREMTVVTNAKSREKKKKRGDDQLKEKNQELTLFKMKSMICVGLTLFVIFGILSNLYDGIIVAKLPFSPFALVRGVTHRNLPGNDDTDCSFMVIYILCSMGIRSSIQKLLGFEPPKGSTSLWNMPEAPENK